jgi:DNA-directed RNA polymerase specialized sigma24 family protein
MNLPEGMKETEVVKQINTVVDRIAPKYAFYGYTTEDIKQEAFIICIEALNRYDPSRPLENFLSVNLSNRLKTFVRDNYFTGSTSEARRKLVQPAQLDYENSIVDEDGKYSTSYEQIDMEEMTGIVDQYMPASVRMDYLKLINDVYVSKQRREEVVDIVKQLLEEHGYYEEG